MFRCLEWILFQLSLSTVQGGNKMLRSQNKGRQRFTAAALVGSGWGGIRTPVRLSPKAVFKTADDFAELLCAIGLGASGENVLAFCLALLQQKWPDLAAVAKAWPTLPEAIRRAILAIVEASK